MRIAVDARPLCHAVTGIGRYTHNVLAELLGSDEHTWFIYTDRPLQLQLPRHEHLHFRRIPAAFPVPGTVSTQLLYPLWCWRDQVDVFWAPGQHLPVLMPGRIRQLLTVHDLVWLEHPETMSSRGRLLDRLLIRRGIRRADHVLTVSESTAELLCARLGVADHHLTVTRLAPTPLPDEVEPELPASLQGTRFLLFVGTLEPRKNLPSLLQAFHLLHRDYPDHKLVICGPEGWGPESIEHQALQQDIRDSVLFTGFVSESQLHGLYQHCEVLAMPSRYEGFGLPALEALAYGKPVVVTPDTEIARLDSPLIHICEGSDPNSIYKSLAEALSAPRVSTPPLDLSWKKTAAATLKSLIR